MKRLIISENMRRFNNMTMNDVSYIIYTNDANEHYYALNGKTGVIDYSSNEATTVIQNVIDRVTEGETIFIKPGTYNVTTINLKPVILLGSGKSTIIKLAIDTNADLLVLYGNTVYYKRCKIANMRIHGNKANNTSGNCIVLAKTQYCILENLWVDNAAEYGIKVLKSFWSDLRDISVEASTDGIKIGECNATKYDEGGTERNLGSNLNLLTNVHVESASRGIHIEGGSENMLLMCDTSGCATGILLKTVSKAVDATSVTRTMVIDHHFETTTDCIKLEDSGIVLHAFLCDYVNGGAGDAWTDYTVQANQRTTNGTKLFPDSPAVNDAFYFGNDRTFGRIRLDIGVALSGTLTYIWEYWNGFAWSELTITSGSTAIWYTGTRNVNFTAQGDWAKTTKNGQNDYWVRVRISGFTNMVAQPLANAIWLDGTGAYVQDTYIINPNFYYTVNQNLTRTYSVGKIYGFERSGATSVADGGTIVHGLDATPTRAICTPSVSGEIVSVIGLGVTNITVAIKKISDGSAGTKQTIYWKAEV